MMTQEIRISNKQRICAMLKSIETGDTEAVEVVNEAKYIQHNPETHEGSEGLAALFKRLSKTSPRVNIVRAFEDGNFVFAHTEYNFDRESVGFEVFRFEDGFAVEHWDNIQARKGPNEAGNSMVDGVSASTTPEDGAANKEQVRSFVQTVLIEGRHDLLTHFIDTTNYTEHNPRLSNDIAALSAELARENAPGDRVIGYRTLHRALAEGDFVLSVCEGTLDGIPASFYDLFRLQAGLIVEHWDTTEEIVPVDQWKNDNGKF